MVPVCCDIGSFLKYIYGSFVHSLGLYFLFLFLDEDAMQWNPLAGANYESSVGMMTRNRTQYGTKSQKTVDILESPMTKRRKRESPTTRRQKRMKQKKPETIDILSSDSEDDAIVVTEKEECDVTKVNFDIFLAENRLQNAL